VPSESTTYSGNVVQALESAGNFTVLLELLKAAGLVEVLSGPGPFTVFAPNDAAWDDAASRMQWPLAKMKAAVIAQPALLTDVLSYHVVSGAFLNSKLLSMNGQPLMTLSGESFSVDVDGTTVSFTDGYDRHINKVGNEIIVSNGVIHLVDGVLQGANGVT
jgi:transforming growth factor-beta-induced protein